MRNTHTDRTSTTGWMPPRATCPGVGPSAAQPLLPLLVQAPVSARTPLPDLVLGEGARVDIALGLKASCRLSGEPVALFQ